MSIEMSESREIPNYPLPGLEPYVKALKNRLYIPEEKSQELQFTNKVRLREWMPEIKIMEDREPVKAKIGSKGVLLSSDMKLPDKIDENTPAEQVVQADALFLAKLEYLREAAPQATSWRRGKTREREVKEQIKDLTSRATSGGGSLEKISLKKVLSGLDKKKVAPALATASFVLAACTRASEPVRTPLSEPVRTPLSEPVRTPLIETTEAAEAKMTEQSPYGVEQRVGGVEDEELYDLKETKDGLVTPETESPISESKIGELASELKCIEGDFCINEVPGNPRQVYFEFVSTGIVQNIDLKDENTGDVLGTMTVLNVVSRDENGKPFEAMVELQSELISEPEHNASPLVSQVIKAMRGETAEFLGEGSETLPTDQWVKVLPEGSMWTFILAKDGSNNKSFLEPTVFGDSEYTSSVKEFIESKGVSVSEDLVLIPVGAASR